MKLDRRTLMCALAALAAALPGAALAEETGIRVVIRVPEDVAVPAPDALLTRLKPPQDDGRLTVRVHKQVESGISETRMDLWGSTIPQGEIEAALRSGFPALAGAEIVVSNDTGEKPAMPEECKGVRKGGKCRVVKKEEHRQKR